MNKVAVVTGGTAGIGRATARLFAERGWSVGLIARDAARLRSAEAELRGLGVEALGIAADVADAAAVDAAAARFEAELGPIGAWVNNAMATIVAPTRSITPEEFRRVTEVTYLGTVNGTVAALRHMAARNSGRIVQVSSILGIRSAPLQSPYCGAKHAVQGFTDSLRAELIHDRLDGVTFSVVYLPAVNTPQYDWARNHTGRRQVAPDPVFDPRLCANAVLSAVESPQREIWVGRSTLQAAVGQAMAPGLLDRYAARMWDAQLGSGEPPRPDGNLFEPAPGDPGVDGPFTARTKPQMREYWTSRSRDAAVAGVAALGLAGLAALAAPALAVTLMAGPRHRAGHHGWRHPGRHGHHRRPFMPF